MTEARFYVDLSGKTRSYTSEQVPRFQTKSRQLKVTTTQLRLCYIRDPGDQSLEKQITWFGDASEVTPHKGITQHCVALYYYQGETMWVCSDW